MTLSQSVQAVGEVERLLRDAIEGKRFGTIEVRKLLALLGEDADGETAVFVNLVLSDPDGETWPFEDAQALRRSVRETLMVQPPPIPYYVSLRPEHEEPQADDEAASS